MTFKFQSDSINTLLFQALLCAVIVFKFQSDSINTYQETTIFIVHTYFKFQSDSINTFLFWFLRSVFCPLNSNLILLIPPPGRWFLLLPSGFKFQSDSINTREKKAAEMLEKYTLNSNLILLILHSHASFTYVCFTLNSNLILLILSHISKMPSILSTLNSNLLQYIYG